MEGEEIKKTRERGLKRGAEKACPSIVHAIDCLNGLSYVLP